MTARDYDTLYLKLQNFSQLWPNVFGPMEVYIHDHGVSSCP